MAASWSNHAQSGLQHALDLGSCNFVDSGRSASVSRCGCRRFWIQTGGLGRQQDQGANMCFCGHHACFHDEKTPRQEIEGLGNQATHSRLSRAASHATSDRPGTGVMHHRGSTAYAGHASSGRSSSRLHQRLMPATEALAMSLDETNTAGVWAALNAFARDQVGAGSEHSSTLPSTIAGSDVPRQDQSRARQSLQVSTNVVPLLRPGTGRQNSDRTTGRETSRSQNQAHESNAMVHSNSESSAHTSDKEMQNMLQACLHRIEALECISYNHVLADDVEEKFEHIDVRLACLEDRQTDLEARIAQIVAEPEQHHRLVARSASSGSSVCSNESITSSVDSQASATAAVYAEYNQRLGLLRQRLDLLENIFPPSPANTWEVEIVLLPFGKNLPGIWVPNENWYARDSACDVSPIQDMAALSFSSSPINHMSSISPGWNVRSNQEWADTSTSHMSARACGPKGLVYQRLLSRGLVHTVQVASPNAADFMHACMTAFEDFLDRCARQRTDRNNAKYDILNEPLIPLRKIKRESRLRFLASSEMVTAALWTPAFLDTGVFMKPRHDERRLYLTTPEAYAQSGVLGWTWGQIRQLTHQNDREKASEDLEKCWDHHPMLDGPLVSFETFPSSMSHQSAWSSKGPHSEGAPGRSPRFATPTSHGSRKDNHRSSSKSRMPSQRPRSNPPVEKRSVDPEPRRTRPKRRRTIDPEDDDDDRGIAARTPRMSREPPSPLLSERHSVNSGNDRYGGNRRATFSPRAYETPHSHSGRAHPIALSDDEDTETDTVIEALQKVSDEEWYGASPKARRHIPRRL